MASAKVQAILHSKGAPFNAEELEQMSDGHGWGWIMAHTKKKAADPNAPLEICFTGFTDAEKMAMALRCGKRLKVVKSVTAHLKFLVGGPHAGPVKLQKAEELGSTILTLEQFESLLANGELPK